MSLPWLIGQWFESVGPRVTMITILMDMVVAAGLFTVLMLYTTRPVIHRT